MVHVLLIPFLNNSSMSFCNHSLVDNCDIEPTHVNLAVDILLALYDPDRTVDEQKILLQLLGQLQLSVGQNLRSIQKLNILLTYHDEVNLYTKTISRPRRLNIIPLKQCPLENSANEKLFNKFRNRFYGLFGKELQQIKPKDYLDEEIRDIYQRIGVDVPDEDEADAPCRVRSRSAGKRKAQESDDEKEDDHQDEAAQSIEKRYDSL
jgi:condensin complex subunit 3